MDNKKKIFLGIGAIAIIVLVLGVSFALWNINIAQEGINKLETDCFKIEFTDKNPISLSNAYPIEDELGMMQTPYTFTMTNVCNGSAKYQINLETMNPNGTKMPDKYLKVNLSEGNISKKTTKLDKSINSSLDTEPTIDGAIEAYKLVSGIMESGETKEFNLRIWMHSEVLASDEDSMNANYQGKISITSSYFVDNRGTMMARDDNYAFWPKEYVGNISRVIIESNLEPKETELTWDVSKAKDGSVMSYLVQNEDNNSLYDLYIQSNVGVKANSNSSGLFYGFTKLANIEGLEYFDTSSATDMSGMFLGCSSLISLDVSNFDTSNVTDMGFMFFGCSNLTSLDASSFDTNNVTNMSNMFLNCSNLTSLDVSNFDTSSVTDMSSMFDNCSSLTSLDVSNFDTSKVTNMGFMFSGCKNLTNLDLRSFDTSSVTDMLYMFQTCNNLISLDVSSFDTSKVTSMSSMFSNMLANALIYVKDETTQNWILSSGNGHPDAWTTENVIIKA